MARLVECVVPLVRHRIPSLASADPAATVLGVEVQGEPIPIAPSLATSSLVAIEVDRSLSAPIVSQGTSSPPSARSTQESFAELTPVDSPLLLVLLGIALMVPLWLLYRRLTRDGAFSNPVRKTIFDLVESNPGPTVGAVARSVGVDHSTAFHHLQILHEFGLVETRPVGRRLRYYKNGGTYTDAEKRAHAALANPRGLAVAAYLVRRPGAGPTEIARSTGLRISTAKSQLRRLERLGVACSGRLVPEAIDVVLRRTCAGKNAEMMLA